jgi:hypothetical protein
LHNVILWSNSVYIFNILLFLFYGTRRVDGGVEGVEDDNITVFAVQLSIQHFPC